MTPKLLKYQDKDADRVETRCGGKAHLGHEMGLGKSCIAITNRKRYGPFKRPTVILCYAILKWNWRNECKKWGMNKTVILSSQTPPHKLPSKEAQNSSTVYIINYDILPYWLQWLKALKPGTIIVDESQAIKNRKTKRCKATKSLGKGIPKKITLSGTPLLNSPHELWTTLNFLRPKRFPSFIPFATRYCKTRRHPRWGLRFLGGKRLDELHRILVDEGIMIRRLKKDVLKQLPPKIRHVIPIELSPALRKEYDKAEKNYVRWLHGTAPHMAANARRIVAFDKKNGLKRLIGQLKLKSVMEWLDLFLEQSDKKILVYGIHYKVLLPLHDKYKKRSVLINGKTPAREREVRVKKFMTNPKCRILFGNIQAGGVGLNLTAAEEVLTIEMGWTGAEHDQVEARAARIGQTRTVNARYMVVRNSIEYDICSMIQRKQEETDMVLDGKLREDTLRIRDQVDASIIKRVKKKGKR